MKRTGTTPPFRGEDGEPLPGSIAEVGYLRLGGVDQWVLIRGEKRTNPPLIVLHGGPGLSEMGFFRRFNAPLEKIFTVIHWDQRGAGRSFDRHLPPSSLTVEQLLSDLDELVNAMRARLGHDKVALFGHSWGSALGVLYAARFPGKVAAYVGSGQIGDWLAGDRASYEFALSEAERAHRKRALKALRRIGAPPWDASQLWIERRWLQRLEGGMPLGTLLQVLFGVPESSIVDLPAVYRGFRSSIAAMWPEVSHLNLIEAAPSLRMPVFFFLGRHDHWVPPASSVAYFDVLDAPSKQLVWFELSGHEPFVDEPVRFNALMAERVRPQLEAR